MITTDQTEIAVSAAVHPPLPSTNLYFMAIMRILDVKTGPFHEHSSQLHSIALGVPNWSKVNSGLFKMYQVRTLLDYISHIYLIIRCGQAEVLGKRVVVQHIPLGGLLEWEHKEVLRPGIAHRVTEPWTSTPHPRTQISSMYPPK
jgi:serine/threonine-protein phosphatase 2A activator